MGLLRFLGLVDKTIDVVGEHVLDKDAQNKILENLEKIKLQGGNDLLKIELSTKTIPWIDALHKMGRLITNWGTILVTFILMLCDIDISGPDALLIGSGNVAYQVIKGKGNPSK